MGLHISDMERLSIGTINDMITESQNDNVKYKEVASQSDFDRF